MMNKTVKYIFWLFFVKHTENVNSFFINKIHQFQVTEFKKNNNNLANFKEKYFKYKNAAIRRTILRLKNYDAKDNDSDGDDGYVDDNDDGEGDNGSGNGSDNGSNSGIEDSDNVAGPGKHSEGTQRNKLKMGKTKKKRKRKNSANALKCKTCNKTLKPRVKFCIYCGTNVSVEKIKLKKYIEDIYLPLRKEEVSDNTYRVEKGFWNDILPKLGKYELHELGSNNWESFLKYLKSKNCSPRTMALYQSTYQIELLLKNSSDMHRAIFALSIGSSYKSTFEYLCFYIYVANMHKLKTYLFVIELGIGLRPSEVLRIFWEDINFEKKEIFIKGQKTKYSNTAIPLTNFAYNELIKWWELENKPSKGLCFYSEIIKNKFNYKNTKTPLKPDLKLVKTDEKEEFSLIC
ncbi:tyrosine recombinase, putative (INT) [Plasmodium ovale wallikeri]|uniref:Tyrosine recombinase, putative (INT) n=1 Tax=Plasmodium ovale wallikeri TaxID=864142 RepID=A0A1A8ZTA7_PLAOA|nr:tyrosine recombinase, putative (INT) [Plasmodium ovale wallikeri]SBT47611.1 tyrosine recombinase, putative (INT) [Plasmodium ovale wallikeri]